MRLLIHAEIDSLCTQWQENAEELRDDCENNDTASEQAKIIMQAQANVLDACAQELNTLNYKVEVGE